MKIVPKNNFLDEVFDDIMAPVRPHNNPMRCDVYEKDGVYNIEVDVPGYNKEDVNIEANDGYITIKASKEEKKEENADKNGKKYFCHERRFGKLERSFYIGDMDADRIKAKMENGTLLVTIPKIDENESKKIINIE